MTKQNSVTASLSDHNVRNRPSFIRPHVVIKPNASSMFSLVYKAPKNVRCELCGKYDG